MATFSRELLRSLAQPAFQESLFTAARNLGAAPARRAALERFNEISKTTGQAQASALSGDPDALALNIGRLEEIRNAAPTLEQKQAIDSRITQLRSMAPAAKQVGLKRDITAVSQIDNTLDGLDARTDISEQQKAELKESLTLRKNQLLDNPEIEQGYRQDQIEAFNFANAQRTMREQEYLTNNSKTFLDVIKTGDSTQLNAVKDKIPDEFRAIAEKYITGAIKNNEINREFEERSIAMRTAPMTKTEIDAIVNQLPERVRANVTPLVNRYKKAAEGWSDENKEWNTKSLANARAAEKELRTRVADLTNQALLSQIRIEDEQRLRKENAVLKLELEFVNPNSTDIENEEMRLAGQDKDKITPEITAQATAIVREGILKQIELFDEDRARKLRVPPQEAIDDVLANPELADDFVRKYGLKRLEEARNITPSPEPEPSDKEELGLPGEIRRRQRPSSTPLRFRDLFPGRGSVGGQARRSMFFEQN